MRLSIEVLRSKQLDDPIDAFVLEQNRAENRFLGFDVLWRNPPQYAVHRFRHSSPSSKGPCANARDPAVYYTPDWRTRNIVSPPAAGNMALCAASAAVHKSRRLVIRNCR